MTYSEKFVAKSNKKIEAIRKADPSAAIDARLWAQSAAGFNASKRGAYDHTGYTVYFVDFSRAKFDIEDGVWIVWD